MLLVKQAQTDKEGKNACEITKAAWWSALSAPATPLLRERWPMIFVISYYSVIVCGNIARLRHREMPGRSPLNRRKDGPPCGGIIATGWRREASTAWLKSMRYCTLTDMHDRDVVGIEPPPSRQII
jgi:hypothetical protein